MSVRELVWKLTADGAGEFAKSVENADGKVDGLKEKIEGSDKSISSAFTGVQGKFKSVGGSLKSVGSGMTKAGAAMTAATMPLAIKLKQGISDARNLDTAIRRVTTLTDENILPTSELKKATKRISNENGIMQTEVAGAMYEALSSGIKTEDVTAFTEQGLKLAKAGFTDLPTVIDVTTTALNAYGEQAKSVAEIQDIMVKTQDLGKITVDELGKNMGRVVPVAAAAGVNIDQLGAAYSMLTSKGQNAQIATTNLNGLLTELSTNGTKADKALRANTGQSFQELTANGMNLGQVLELLNNQAKNTGLNLGDMFGNISASAAANSLFDGTSDGFTKTLTEMQNSQGAVDANYKKMLGDELEHAQAIEKMRNAFIDMGTAVSPVVSSIMNKIGELAMRFQELSPHQQKVVSLFALIAVASGPLLMILGGLVMGIGAIVSGIALLSAPVMIAVGAFALLTAAGVALAFHWETVKTKAAELGGAIKSKLQEAANAVSNGFNRMKTAVNNVLESIRQKWESVKAFFAKPIKGVINIAGGAIGGIMNKAKSLIPGHATGLNEVPYDEYTANLHKGEMVLTAKASKQFRSLGGTKDGLPSLISNGNGSETINTQSRFNPTVVINLYGNADDNTVGDIRDVVKSEFNNMFRQLQLQRS